MPVFKQVPEKGDSPRGPRSLPGVCARKVAVVDHGAFGQSDLESGQVTEILGFQRFTKKRYRIYEKPLFEKR